MESGIRETPCEPPPLPPLPPAIGLDFGTSYSRAAIFKDNEVKLVKDPELGTTSIPSYVSFSKNPDSSVIKVGKEARDLAQLRPTSTVYGFKRLIGQKYERLHGVETERGRTFEVIADKNGLAVVKVKHSMGRSRTFIPKELTTMILKALVRIVQLSVPVRDAVVTIPTCFDYLQREKMRQACEAAGLNVLHFIDEATATAVFYGIKYPSKKDRNVFVINIGGGYLSIAVVAISASNHMYEVKSVSGDANLGGNNFDNRVINYLVEEFEKKTKSSLSGNDRAIWEVKHAVGIAKRNLSTANQCHVNTAPLSNATRLNTVITREKFEELNDDLFKCILGPIVCALSDAKLDKSQVHDVVLSGGSTKIPKIRALVRDFFNGKEPNICPQAPTYGAAILATSIQGTGFKELDLIPVTPFSIGIESADGTMRTMIKRNSALPAEKCVEFIVNSAQKKNLEICIYEGEESLAKENLFLGEICFKNIPPSLHGKDEYKFELYTSIDRNCNCVVTLTNTVTKRKETLTVSLDSICSRRQSATPKLFLPELPIDDDYGGNISDASMESEASAYITVLSPKNSSSPLQNSLRSRSASPRAQNTDESLYVQLPSVEMIKKLQARRKASCPSALVCSTPPQINLQLTDEVTLDSRKSANRLKNDKKKWKSQTNIVDSGNDAENEHQIRQMLEKAIVEANYNARQAKLQAKEAKEQLESRVTAANQTIRDMASQLKHTTTELLKSLDTRKNLQQKLAQSLEDKTFVEERYHMLAKMLEQVEQMVLEERDRADLAERRISDAGLELEDASCREVIRKSSLTPVTTQDQTSTWLIRSKEIEITERVVGRGMWAYVKLAKFRGLECAAKCIHSVIISDKNRCLFIHEMNIASQLRHPNIVQFIGATMEQTRGPVILTELMHCNLRSMLEKTAFDPSQITSISLDVARALNYLHLMQPDPVIHRAVSSTNVLLNRGPSNTYVAKLSDCGSANFVRGALTTGHGSENLAYSAPESIDSSKRTPKLDVYSYGVLLLEICTCKLPDPATIDQSELIKRVTMSNMVEVITRCTQEGQRWRPTMSQILDTLTTSM